MIRRGCAKQANNKGQIKKMQETINELKRRKKELKRMLPSGSGDQGTYCSCKKKRGKNEQQS